MRPFIAPSSISITLSAQAKQPSVASDGVRTHDRLITSHYASDGVRCGILYRRCLGCYREIVLTLINKHNMITYHMTLNPTLTNAKQK